MGFRLKPNDYKKMDWMWLIGNIEKELNLCCHGWLSSAEVLVLIKSVLEAILIFFMALAWILKGILNIIWKKCCGYLWRGEKEGILFSLIKWEHIYLPKRWGGWVIYFCKISFVVKITITDL